MYILCVAWKSCLSAFCGLLTNTIIRSSFKKPGYYVSSKCRKLYMGWHNLYLLWCLHSVCISPVFGGFYSFSVSFIVIVSDFCYCPTPTQCSLQHASHFLAIAAKLNFSCRLKCSSYQNFYNNRYIFIPHHWKLK